MTSLKRGPTRGTRAAGREGLQPHARKEIGHAVVVLLGPLRQRMIVAMGAGDVDAQKRLGHVLRDVQRIAVDHPVVGRAILQRVAGGGDDLGRQT